MVVTVNLFFLFLLMSLTVYRLTRLVVRDTFPPILWIRKRLVGDETEEVLPSWSWTPTWVSDLLSCPYCASGWISLGTMLIVDAYTSLPLPILWWFAIWAGGVVTYNYEDRPDSPNFDRVTAVQDFLMEAIRDRDLEIAVLKRDVAAIQHLRPTATVVRLPEEESSVK